VLFCVREELLDGRFVDRKAKERALGHRLFPALRSAEKADHQPGLPRGAVRHQAEVGGGGEFFVADFMGETG
jgi:hypothetical protein